ncbi:response regulator [Aquimarina sp. AD10]|uniref:Transcriptional regulator n=1 Tax=Aquimarina aggregata TaxID=1642818 RepID=A0A162CNG2_9FLAO|nr:MULTISPECIES: response regulator [Aquimarina]AXT62084.1 response regulator [Aquimarina sp. AD10]KZS39784.1 transcriptional regulator [Aquimarina aggregata]RKM99927.1 response regulator [Aquimarina sp. AD10]
MSQSFQSVCIIDDDNIYINLVSKIIELRRLSKSVLVFNNGKEALDFFLASLQNGGKIPEVIFLDINMPIMDGWEFLKEFSKIKNQGFSNINLYVVSSSIDSRDIERAKAIDIVSDYIAKPIKLNDFERILM